MGKLRRLRIYFGSWSPREIVLLVTAGVLGALSVGFGWAWVTSLVPWETQWGNVAEWAGVIVTALGFLVAGLTFYFKFREVSEAKDQQDLDTVFQLNEMASTERQKMEAEASRVNFKLRPPSFFYAHPDPKVRLTYQLAFEITNDSGRKLTGIRVHLPPTSTSVGDWDAGALAIEDSDQTLIPVETNIRFSTHTHRPGETDMSAAHDAYSGKANLEFRVGSGPRWELIFDPEGNQRPKLTLN